MPDPAAGSTGAVRRRVVRRVVWSTLLLLVLSAAGVSLAVNAAAGDIAIRDASLHGSSFARYVVAPLVNSAVRRGDTRALAHLDAVLKSPLRDGAMVRIKIWDQDGHVLWSDAGALGQETFELEPEEAALFGTDGVVASVSDLTKEENATERGFGNLVEVYAAARDAEGGAIVAESYWNSDRIRQDGIVISEHILPLGLSALALALLAVIPLALSLARRVDQAQAERASLLRHALAASDMERRKISRELHDGLIQDLTSLGYALPAVASGLSSGGPNEADGILRTLSERLQGDIASLRGVLADIYPVSLTREGLAVATEQLAEPLRSQGVEVLVDVDPALDSVSEEAVQLAYQVIREGLRNVAKHARATSVRVVAGPVGEGVVVVVEDDGKGGPFPPPGRGHLGLRLLEDCAADVGGYVKLGPASTGGARLAAHFPQTFAWSSDR
ncbi:sensor histidine kinase [Terrabacter koreensis]